MAGIREGPGIALASRSQETVSQLEKRKKAPKGTVSVQVFKERLRLVLERQKDAMELGE